MITELALQIIRIILGFAFALFIPGFIIVYIFFREFQPLEKIAFSVVFSMMISIAIAIFLGYNEEWASKTGGLTFKNIVKMEAYVMAFLLFLFVVALIYQKRKRSAKVFKKSKILLEKKDEKTHKKEIRWY